MEGSERRSRTRLKVLGILLAVVAISGCSGGGGSNGDLEGIKKDIADLKAWRDATGKWEDSLWKSYSHAYVCDTDHKAEKKCPPATNHVPPPSNPPK